MIYERGEQTAGCRSPSHVFYIGKRVLLDSVKVHVLAYSRQLYCDKRKKSIIAPNELILLKYIDRMYKVVIQHYEEYDM